MIRRLSLILGIAALLIVLALGVRQPTSRASSLSRSADGWLAARLYLQGRGDAIELVDSRSALVGSGVLVTVFPWSGSPPFGDVEPFLDHLAAGGVAMVGISDRGGVQQDLLLESLDLEVKRLREAPPLGLRRWFAYQRQTTVLKGPAVEGVIAIRSPTWGVVAPEDAEVLFSDVDQRVVGFSVDRQPGRLVVVPAAVLDNAGFRTDGGASVLESLRAQLPRGDDGAPKLAWRFDEYHHGLRSKTAEGGYRGTAVLTWIAQLALIYALVVYSLARPFGSSWAPAERVSESTGRFLRGLGRTHRRLARFNEAAQAMLSRSLVHDSRFTPSAQLHQQASQVDSGSDLLRFAEALYQAKRQLKGDQPHE